jgi:16S rRNA processing protein RimM
VESIRGAGDLIVKFEDIKVREDALLLQSKPVFLPATEIPEDLDTTELEPEYAGVTGYLLIDQHAGEIGRITEVLEMPQQEMAVVQYQGREVLIPLNDQFILSVDHAGQKVLVDLPEGLLEL